MGSEDLAAFSADPKAIARFRAFLRQDGECLLWTGGLVRGYGKFRYRGQEIKAHRLSYQHSRGLVLPQGLLVCHTCDRPPCCNPAHLFAGTMAENMADMVAKGRSTKGQRRGSANSSAKLHEEDVVRIRALIKERVAHHVIGSMFDVSKSTIYAISVGRLWAIVENPHG